VKARSTIFAKLLQLSIVLYLLSAFLERGFLVAGLMSDQAEEAT